MHWDRCGRAQSIRSCVNGCLVPRSRTKPSDEKGRIAADGAESQGSTAARRALVDVRCFGKGSVMAEANFTSAKR